MNPRRAESSLSFSTKMILAAGVALGASLLVACGDSPNAEANKQATENADEATRWTKSAGDFRATPALKAKGFAVDRDDAKKTLANTQAITDSLSEPIKKDPSGKEFKTYIERNDLLVDLKKADDLLDKSLLPSVPLSSLLRSNLSGQLAQNQLVESRILANRAETKLRDLAVLANSIVMSLDEIGGLTYAANALAERKDASVIQNKVDAAAKASAAAASDKTDADAAFKKLQDEKADLENRATELEKKAEAQFAAADVMKLNDKAAVKAYDDALAAGQKTFSEAKVLRQDALILEPKITAAKLDVELATLRAAEAKTASDALAVASAALSGSHNSAAGEATRLREEIDKLLKGPTGLTTRVESFKTLGAEVEKLASAAAAKASGAQKNFGLAATNQASVDTDLRKKLSDGEIKADDPLATLAAQKEHVAAFRVLEGSAYNALGEAKLLGVSAATLRDLVNDVARKTSPAATQPVAGTQSATATAPAVAEGTTTVAVYGEDAQNAFRKGIETASGNSMNLTPATRWLGDYVVAVGQFGVSIANPDSGQSASALEAAKKAAQEAIAKNPTLAFPGLVTADAVKSGPAPETKGSDMGHEVPKPAEKPPEGD